MPTGRRKLRDCGPTEPLEAHIPGIAAPISLAIRPRDAASHADRRHGNDAATFFAYSLSRPRMMASGMSNSFFPTKA